MTIVIARIIKEIESDNNDHQNKIKRLHIDF